MGLRGLYDAIERAVTPGVEAVVRSDELATVGRVVNATRRAVGSRIDALSGGVLHLANLPTATDVRRLRRQVGEIDFELRRLRMELETRDGDGRDGQGTADGDRS
ncbi:hypothetical protein P0W64_04125 [Tsukamurella sp. 8F]|uniref:hypothetical protein n=1 Tax=unclassified Tsukamurella TaxID=2633480 RepID=UPI0023B8BC0B|nr:MULTISPECIES: hypothetical protein [unclassified Tsukamurella]MDF0529674.1 hypothetical protein [Tsukamurella sp. 8J]MDF0585959.1 hypothetical protein [Tsukamurella sp. 8F]